MRLFIALDPDPGTRQKLMDLQDRLRQAGWQGNWTRSENLHLTLAFLGECTLAHKDRILRILEESSFPRTQLDFAGCSHFGSLWYAAFRQDPALTEAVYALQQALRDAGLPVDTKPFVPHITFLRRARISTPGAVRNLDLSFVLQTGRPVLYVSRQTGGQLVYTPVTE